MMAPYHRREQARARNRTALRLAAARRWTRRLLRRASRRARWWMEAITTEPPGWVS